MTVVLVPRDRVHRWVANFEERHGATTLAVLDGALVGRGADGSSFAARAPFDRAVVESSIGSLVEAAAPPEHWGLLLVRKGGFAVARLTGEVMAESKVGQRHVQGRTKAGGQSQQRFARRRDNQARAAYEAAADHAARVLVRAPAVVVGGDHVAVAAVLADRRLAGLSDRVCGPFLTVPDPRRGVLESAARDASSVRIEVTNA